jgi:hypothetical protein
MGRLDRLRLNLTMNGTMVTISLTQGTRRMNFPANQSGPQARCREDITAPVEGMVTTGTTTEQSPYATSSARGHHGATGTGTKAVDSDDNHVRSDAGAWTALERQHRDSVRLIPA